MATKTSAISFDNTVGGYSKIDNSCLFICDLDMYTKLYTHYHEPTHFLIIKFDENENLDIIFDLPKKTKRIFGAIDFEEVALYSAELTELLSRV